MALATRDKIELSAIVLTTDDGREVRLSVAQARALHTQLDALFGVKQGPSYPIYIERDRWPAPWRPYSPWITWCAGSSSSTTASAEVGDSGSGLKVRYEGSL